MGQPSPVLDHHWYQLSKSELRSQCTTVPPTDVIVFNFGVDRGSLLKVNKTGAAAEFPGTGKYQASLMAFHQLHCLVRLSQDIITLRRKLIASELC
jgi:hypothetical protein